MAGIVEGDLDPLGIEGGEGLVFGTNFDLARTAEQSVGLGVGAVAPRLCAVLVPMLAGAAVWAGGDGNFLAVAAREFGAEGVASVKGGIEVEALFGDLFVCSAQPRSEGWSRDVFEDVGRLVGHGRFLSFGG